MHFSPSLATSVMPSAQHFSPEQVLQRQADIATCQRHFLEKHGASRVQEPGISMHPTSHGPSPAPSGNPTLLLRGGTNVGLVYTKRRWTFM